MISNTYCSDQIFHFKEVESGVSVDWRRVWGLVLLVNDSAALVSLHRFTWLQCGVMGLKSCVCVCTLNKFSN